MFSPSLEGYGSTLTTDLHCGHLCCEVKLLLQRALELHKLPSEGVDLGVQRPSQIGDLLKDRERARRRVDFHMEH